MSENNAPTKETLLKNWKSYVFEFLMLFLAVTLSFVVDNLREDFSDRAMERQRIRALGEDLRQDTALFQRQMRDLNFVITCSDSVILLLKQKTRSVHDLQRLYYLTRRIAPKVTGLYINDRTYEEMRGSGTLRLIHHKNVSDSISKYYFNSKELSFMTSIAGERMQHKLELEAKLFDASVYSRMVDSNKFIITPPVGNPWLISEDPGTINEFSVTLHYISSWCVFSKIFLAKMDGKANRLMALLEDEYRE